MTSSSNGPSVLPRIVVIFRNDDPSALSELEHEREIFALFQTAGVPQTLGIVPNMTVSDVRDPHGTGEKALGENPAMAAFLAEYLRTSGSEAALHGFTHRTGPRSQPGRREYFEFRGLSADEQERRIRAGADLVEAALGVRPETFVPPWNRLDAHTPGAAARAGCRFLSAGPHVPAGAGVAVVGTNASLAEFGDAYAAAKKSSRRVFISLLFHSSTVRSAEEKALLKNILDTVRGDAECGAMTIAATARAFPEELRVMNDAGMNFAPFHDQPESVRARAWLHLNALPALGAWSGLDARRQQAREWYRAGEYEKCAALTPAMDQTCRRLVWAGRAAAALAGAAAGILLAALGMWAAVFTALPLLAGALLSRRATGAGTRAELATLSCMAALAFAVAFFATRTFA